MRHGLRIVVGFAVFLTGALPVRSACDPLPRGVAGFWSGDDSAADLTSNGNHGTPLNGVAYAAGSVADGFLFDGVDDRIEVADSPNLRPAQFTLAAWVRADVATLYGCILCKQVGPGDANSLSLWVNNGTLQGGMFRYAEAVAPTLLPVGQLVHVAVTYDGTTIRLYTDGVLVSAVAGPVSTVPYDANPLIIGVDDNGNNAFQGYFRGIIDEAQVFGRALSTCEIRALVRVRPQGSCKGDADLDLVPDFEDDCPMVSNAGQQDSDGDGVGDACDCAPGDPATSAAPGDRNLLAFAAKDRLDWCRDPESTGTATVYDVLRGDLGTLPVATATSKCRSRCIAPLPGLVGWWTGDGNTIDLVGGLDGTLENGAGYGDGLTLQAIGFDGVNDRVRTGNLTLGNTFSVAAWVRSDVVRQVGYARIAETSYATAFFLGTEGVGTAYKFIVKSPTSPFGTANGGSVTAGEWQFVAGTYDGATGTLYVDGTAVASNAFAPPGTTSLPLNLGAYLGGGNVWKGRIDEILVYDRALSAGEVRTLYESAAAGSCKSGLGGTDASWTVPWAPDASVPAPGSGYWYLYRGRNACGTGSYGYATSAAERISTVCN